MEDQKVLTIYWVGVLCMLFYAYNDLVGGNRYIPGDALLINGSTYVQSLCKLQTLTLMWVLVKIFSPLLALGILMERIPNATSDCRCVEIWALLIEVERHMIMHR